MGSGRIALLGGRVIDPAQQIDRVADLLLVDGCVEAVTARTLEAAPQGYEVIDARGLVVAPGFVDLHCHLREPGYEHKETIASGTAAAARGGFTTVCAMPNTDPPQDTASVIESVLREAEAHGSTRLLPIGCVTRGRAGKELSEMTALAQAGAVAFSDDGDPVADPNLMRQALSYAGGLGLPVINHCEDLSLSRSGDMNEGAVSVRLGLAGVPAEAESVMVGRDCELAELTGGRAHIAHLSVVRSVEHVRRAKERGVDVTAEATPHHLTLTEDWVYGLHGELPEAVSLRAYDTNTKVNPPLRSREDAEALVEALREGVIDAVATDHAPHAAVDKVCSYPEAERGINVLETAFGSLMTLVHQGGIGLPVLLERLTAGPARVLRRDLGSLREGWPADVVLLDPDAEWIVAPEAFASKSRNTPLAGVTLKGRVVVTLLGGRVVFDGRSEAAMSGTGG